MGGYHGFFLWHELMTTDPDGARSFYPSVTGWTLTPGGIPGMDYDMWTTPRGPVGGVMQLPAEAQKMGANTHWIPYVGTTDIAATATRAAELGAPTYVPVTDIPGVGQFSVLGDPEGATFAVYQPAAPAEGEARPGTGDFSWHELATSDVRAALAFYGDLFGWSVREENDMGELGMYYQFGDSGHTFGGMFVAPPEMGGASWCCYARVDDIQKASRAVVDGGGTIMNGPMEVPGGDMITQCMDPQGGVFALHEMKS